MIEEQRGSVFVEYTLLLTLVSIGAMAATSALGPPFLDWYRMQRLVLLLPIPS